EQGHGALNHLDLTSSGLFEQLWQASVQFHCGAERSDQCGFNDISVFRRSLMNQSFDSEQVRTIHHQEKSLVPVRILSKALAAKPMRWLFLSANLESARLRFLCRTDGLTSTPHRPPTRGDFVRVTEQCGPHSPRDSFVSLCRRQQRDAGITIAPSTTH